MADTFVRDWINDYKSLDEVEISSFCTTLLQNNDLIQALFSVLEEKRYHQEFLEAVCQQFFLFYQSKDIQFQRFSQQYIPCLISIYLSHVAKGTRQNVRCVEILLLEIYNLEAVDSTGKPLFVSFRIPSIAKPSIYHEPMSMSHSMLTEDALSHLEYQDCRKYTLGPIDEVERINASNRLHVMTTLMWLYNQNIGFMTTFSHMSLCKMCMRIVKQGYNRSSRSNFGNDCSSTYGNPHPRPIARIPVSPALLLEMVHSVYYVMFNGMASIGLQSLEELHNRAAQEMLPDVLLVTNAIRNSLKFNPSGQPCDGPMGLSISLSPTTVISSVSRAITNASFRTKKLPDDIPIQGNGEANDSHQLSSINEEEGPETTQAVQLGSIPNRSKKQVGNGTTITKVGVLQLRKDKGKDKRKESMHSESNGKLPATTGGISHNDISSSDLNAEEFHHLSRFASADQVPVRHSYPYKTEQVPKSALVSSSSEYNHNFSHDRLYEGKCANNFSNPDLNAVLKSDIKFSSFHKSESANGIQSSSMQTAV